MYTHTRMPACTHVHMHTHPHTHTHTHVHKTHTHKHVHIYIHVCTHSFPHLQVYRLPVEECSNFTDCSSCITSGGRLCGWCNVENKCSRSTQCTNSSTPLRWIRDSGQCLTVNISSAVSISGDVKSYPREQHTIVSIHSST